MVRTHRSRAHSRRDSSDSASSASASPSPSDHSSVARLSLSHSGWKYEAHEYHSMSHRSSRRSRGSDSSESESDSSAGSSDERSDADSRRESDRSSDDDDEALLEKHLKKRHHHKKHKKHHRRRKAAAAVGPAYAQDGTAHNQHGAIVAISIFIGILLVAGLGFGAYYLLHSSSLLSGGSSTSAATTAAGTTAAPTTAVATTAPGTTTTPADSGSTATDTGSGDITTPATITAATTAGESRTSAASHTSGAVSGSRSGSASAGGSFKLSGSASGTHTNTASASKSSGSGTATTNPGTKVIGAWWAAYNKEAPSAYDWSKYSHAFYFAAYPSSTAGDLTWDSYQDSYPSDFPVAVHSAGAKAMLTVGGWDGSADFSTLMSTNDTRTAFIKILQTALSTYGYDGIDIDWEYPGEEGGSSNYSKDDLANFLSFYQELRASVGADVLLSAAAKSTPWVDDTGAASTDMSGFGDVLDFVELMQYDGNPGTDSGPNFPLVSSCAPSGTSWAFSVEESIDSWVSAGFPADKILLGIGAYGHTWTVPKFSDTGAGQDPSSTVYQVETAPGTPSTILYSTMAGYGWLDGSNSSAEQTFDNCTSTPFVYVESETLLVPYDDANSIKAKCGYGMGKGTRGAVIFTVDGDSSDVLVGAMNDNC